MNSTFSDLEAEADLSFEQAIGFSNSNPELSDKLEKQWKTLKKLRSEQNELMHKLGLENPLDIEKELARSSEKSRKTHIKKLNEYNGLKDIAMQLVSMIAEKRSITITDVLNEMGVDPDDDGGKGKRKRKHD
ncbi:hypothetical protein BRETT_004683 [Brettanomyces bruxellensis]|uniref:Uncharacterized protein n=1 Tax=Dekkera bruxellensis TaxID=5007 RepID=A0A871R793_DEKBR|nr:uncharacterized protein BRETT_004683 [Brettanomyces bruxellensis]QOU20035.1 hypothetical protein BRETT_004683 [Brettanomyces bruxellensis]